MNICFEEPTIDELLGDSLTQSLMQADRVDAVTLRAMLHTVASRRKATIVQKDLTQGPGDSAWIPNVWPAERSHRSSAWAAIPT
jgi:hypothetical protein